jgi:hypothetical protein
MMNARAGFNRELRVTYDNRCHFRRGIDTIALLKWCKCQKSLSLEVCGGKGSDDAPFSFEARAPERPSAQTRDLSGIRSDIINLAILNSRPAIP